MADTVQVPSPSGSMAGYSFVTLIKNNKDKVKLMISALGAFGTAQIGLIQNQALNTLLSTLAGAILYIILAAVDYYLTDIPATPAS